MLILIKLDAMLFFKFQDIINFEIIDHKIKKKKALAVQKRFL